MYIHYKIRVHIIIIDCNLVIKFNNKNSVININLLNIVLYI